MEKKFKNTFVVTGSVPLLKALEEEIKLIGWNIVTGKQIGRAHV